MRKRLSHGVWLLIFMAGVLFISAIITTSARYIADKTVIECGVEGE